MKKWFALILTFLLLLILSYSCFTRKSQNIKNNLLSKVNTSYAKENMSWVKVKGLEGSDLTQSRVLVIEGVAKNQFQREKAYLIADKSEGILSVKNYITISHNDYISKEKNEIIEEETEVEIEKPIYKLTITKAKGYKIVLIKGVVPNITIHHKLITKAKKVFGEVNVIDELEEKQGTPKDWYKSIELGLEELQKVQYGQFKLINNEFKFQGLVQNQENKSKLLNHLNQNLAEYYVGDYSIEISKIKLSCQKEMDTLLSKNRIYFQYNKNNIKKESYILLNSLANVLKNICLKEFIEIEGHTDSKGKKDYNLELSTKRANSVKTYLLNQGVKESKIEAIGYGESQPIASNKTKEGQKENRRIEFKIRVSK